MAAPMITLAAWTDYIQLIVVIGIFAFSGLGWLLQQIRQQQAKYKARQLNARQNIPTSSRAPDVAERRRQQLQDLGKRRQQQMQQANAQRQSSTPQQARQPQQAQTRASSGRQSAKRTQTQQATQPQTRRTSPPRPMRPSPALPSNAKRSQLQRRSQRTAPITDGGGPRRVEEVIELTPMHDMPRVLGVPLHKAFILKEILDKPVALRDTENHPVGM